jgi:hypothetical protein
MKQLDSSDWSLLAELIFDEHPQEFHLRDS